MGNVPPRMPVSDKILDRLIGLLQSKPHLPEIISVEKGLNGQMLFKTGHGEVVVPVTEDGTFVFLELPGASLLPCYLKAELLLTVPLS
jgi:hypothetical protein